MRILFALFPFLLFAACSRPAAAPPSEASALRVDAPFWSNVADAPKLLQNDPVWEQRRWLEKAVRFFRGGDGLRAGESPDEWLKLTPDQIVAKLAQDARFGDTVLDFDMYFLGFKADRVKLNKTYDIRAYSFPAAIESARAVLANGDFFSMLDLEAPVFLGPVTPLGKTEEEKPLPNLEVYKRRYAAFLASGQPVIDYAKSPGATLAEACQREMSHLDSFVPLFSLGLQQEVIFELLLNTPEWYPAIYNDCYTPETLPATLAAHLEQIQTLNTKLFTLLEPYADDAYKPGTVDAIRPFDLSQLGIQKRWLSWGQVQRAALKNSSTNMDRKRAAYVLKRYFCDDLTPVGIGDDPNHGTGPHGSQPSCKACHYKLDPMAGFFRTYGNSFKDYSGKKRITFDDNAKVDLQDYVNNWRAPAGSPREWNVGYVRSITDESLNDYGSSLEDLHANFRKAPEVKACLVRRMFEYGVGDAQTIDPGYLADVTKEFTARAATDSSGAIRWLAGQVALSNTFRQANPVPEQCYDYKQGTAPTAAPPCRVAYLLQQNCVSCHKSTADHGSLSLGEWQSGPDGKKTFPHLGDDGKPLPLAKTLAMIVDRLTTNDPDQRMPSKGRYMSAQDRQALYEWSQKTLDGLQKRSEK